MAKSNTTCSPWGKTKKDRTRQCPKGTNYNKKSKRCIKRDGTIGKKRCLTNCKSTHSRDKNKFSGRCLKNCKPNTRRNKVTNRCKK